MIIKGDLKSRTNEILYKAENLDAINIHEKAWRGLDSNGEIYQGPFKYEFMVATVDGRKFMVVGKACSIVCNSNPPSVKVFPDCIFQTQIAGDGEFQSFFPAFDVSCY